jgi:hypothetical protein
MTRFYASLRYSAPGLLRGAGDCMKAADVVVGQESDAHSVL